LGGKFQWDPNMKYKSLDFCISIIFTIIISSCNPFSNDKGFLSIFQSTINCTNPCWKGIEPGKTSKEYLIILIDKLGLPIEQEYMDDNYSSYLFLENEYYLHFIRTEKNFVSQIVFFGPKDIMLEEIITRIGEPNNSICVYLAAGKYYMSLLYPKRGLDIDVEVYQYDNKFVINKDSNILSATFRNELDINSMVNDIRVKAVNNLEITNASNLLQEWHGYGEYSRCL
jgi:hypothetical protein